MTSTGHGAPAMIPVRRLERSNSLEARVLRAAAMNIVGTPYSDVQRSASTASSTATGSKPRARDHDARAVGERSTRLPSDHAEAVVERHRHADAVGSV